MDCVSVSNQFAPTFANGTYLDPEIVQSYRNVNNGIEYRNSSHPSSSSVKHNNSLEFLSTLDEIRFSSSSDNMYPAASGGYSWTGYEWPSMQSLNGAPTGLVSAESHEAVNCMDQNQAVLENQTNALQPESCDKNHLSYQSRPQVIEPLEPSPYSGSTDPAVPIPEHAPLINADTAATGSMLPPTLPAVPPLEAIPSQATEVPPDQDLPRVDSVTKKYMPRNSSVENFWYILVPFCS